VGQVSSMKKTDPPMTGHDWEGIPYLALTPLYRFSSDSDDLRIGDVFRIVKYRDDLALSLPADDIFLKHLQLNKPDYLLWQRAPVASSTLREVMDISSFRKKENPGASLQATLSVLFFHPAINIFRLLRLFKPGKLYTADTFVISCESRRQGGWETTFSHRCSQMTLDYGLLHVQTGSYMLSSQDDVPFLRAFSDKLLPLLESLNKYSDSLIPLEMALQLYGQDEAHESLAVLNAFTALEALLTNESNNEISYRLSLRVANLLGADETSRKELFRDMKDFYDLRSRIIHGSVKMKPKLQARLTQVDSLREILRRTILSVMALVLAGRQIDQLEDLFDEILFDEEKRKEVQAAASKFLHVVGSNPVVH
jgi:hypothetical protein